MSPFRPPKQHLPEHLKHRKKGLVGRGGTTSTPEEPLRAPRQVPEEAAGSERLSELLPVVLRAMVGDRAAGFPNDRPVIIGQPEILEALSPYHRPRSRFEGLMVRKLVGEGYLKPRGARDKSGLSDTYELTPKGKNLLELRPSR